MDSILDTVKIHCNVDRSDKSFDEELIIHTNGVLFILSQLGVGPEEGFFIEDALASWDEFIPDVKNLRPIKDYVGLKVRMIFDPPTSSAVAQAFNDMIKEYESRINIAFDAPKEIPICKDN